ncbi:hypothetical protein, partial [Nocardiopsis changdeensis]|uniref:hypothetical protein n=1 Tax=Nocardiopsis changdeensis TaxID=2831969 RepID=UPI003F48CD1B
MTRAVNSTSPPASTAARAAPTATRCTWTPATTATVPAQASAAAVVSASASAGARASRNTSTAAHQAVPPSAHAAQGGAEGDRKNVVRGKDFPPPFYILAF